MGAIINNESKGTTFKMTPQHTLTRDLGDCAECTGPVEENIGVSYETRFLKQPRPSGHFVVIRPEL